MTRSTTTTFALLAGFSLLGLGTACKKPEPVQPAPPAPVKAAPTAPATDNQDAKKRQDELDAARKAEEARRLEAEKQAAFRLAAAAALQDIHFDYDKYEIKAEDRHQLQKISDFMRTYPAVKVEIQGHCDERGTNEYNLALGNRRASATLHYLLSLGVPEQKFTLISYGKEKPLCTEGNEACWSKNRRAHFELK
ncbi:MAG: peptidoglycan-associated lipoprotein Pal [Geothrix sp.]|nr:peptidoglycan-associated lipoprotein Pal [Geothrix sp.]